MMVFEFEGYPRVEQLVDVLGELGASVDVEISHFSRNFPESNAFFVYTQHATLEDIGTDQANPLGWKIGARLIVHCPIRTLAESAQELDDFMAALVRGMNNRFLLSFQYESIYAVRDHDLVVYKKMIE
jgi:hypothetical protein